jgi:hypothetical protein
VPLALLLSAAPLGAEPIRRPDFQRGITFAAWTRDEYASPAAASQLEALRELGADSVAIVARWFQATRRSTAIAADPERSPSDASVRAIVRRARGLGLRVLLKPQLDLTGEGWRGEIGFEDERDWAAWFASYRGFAEHYARMAAEEGVEILCIGVELDGTRHREAEWRALARAVRAIYPGQLTYAANFDRERDVTWWDALDYAGVDAYFPLGAGTGPDALRRAWEGHLAGLRAWAARIGRPVLFTEIGYRSVRGAGREPWEWQKPGPVALNEQAVLVRAALEALRDEPWLHGLYFWQWRATPPADPRRDTDYTPQGKPAEDVLRKHFGGVRGASPAVQVAPVTSPSGYDRFELELVWAGSPQHRFVLWPHEGVSLDGAFAFVRRAQVEALAADPRGGLRWRVATDGAAVTLSARAEAEGDALVLRYELANITDSPRFVSIAPCLQLPRSFRGADAGWARSKRVLAPTQPGGWRWISDLAQTRGERAAPSDPDPDASPWAQHLRPAALEPDPARDAPGGLRLFGIAAERAASDVIVAFDPASGSFVAAAASGSHGGVTFSLLDCLHAGIAAELAPRESRTLELHLLLHRGSFESLLGRMRAWAPVPDVDPGLVPPGAREVSLETRASAAADSWRSELLLPPDVSGPAWLTLDAELAPDAGSGASLELAVLGPDGARLAHLTATPSRGKPRRLVAPLHVAGRALQVELRVAGAATSPRLQVTGVSLHLPPPQAAGARH